MYNRLTIFQGEGQPAIPSFNWNPEDSPERFFDEPLGVNVDTLKLISNSAVPCLSGWVSADPCLFGRTSAASYSSGWPSAASCPIG